MNSSSTFKAVAAALLASPVLSPSVWSDPEAQIVRQTSASSPTSLVPIAQAVNGVAAASEVQPHLRRSTTSQEEVAGEIRSWALWPQNWDGEGAAAPLPTSLAAAVSFVRLLDARSPMPEPMLLASGKVAVYWRNDARYAELEFQGDNTLSYFIELVNERHKGLIGFNRDEIPTKLQILLGA